ncbi:hypothetical protein ABTN25_19840, partial [Acinetobacter baumannii]
ATSLKVKKTSLQDAGNGQKIAVSTYFQEYKNYNGVQIPVKMMVDQGQVKINITATDVKVNQGLKTDDWK